jgi:phosphohistidine swiveling domain-containing protein
MNSTTFVRPLTSVGLADAGVVGHKSAVLGELSAAGFPVPPGYVLTADVLDRVLATGPANRLRTMELPVDVTAALAGIAANLAGRPVAVRSSATDEDLPGASFAGQYESILDVEGVRALTDAVRTCWASAYSERVTAYHETHGTGGSRRVGVLIQHMVPADAAGVAFSANPVTGERDEVLVSAVRGLGDRLVSGEATPDEWAVRAGTASLVAGDEHAIDAVQAAAIAALAEQIEDRFGCPQDIEWAFHSGQLWVLQARPITALPEAPSQSVAAPVVPPPGYWQLFNYAARPLSPMARSTVLRSHSAHLIRLLDYSLGESLRLAEIGGWLYSSFQMTQGPQRIRAKLEQVMAAVRADEPGRLFRRWHEEWQPQLAGDLARLRDRIDPAALSDDQLTAHLTEVLELAEQASEIHFRLGGAGMLALGELGLACSELLDWDTTRTLTLLTGLPGSTTEPSYRLAELVRLTERDPALRKLVADRGTAVQPLLLAAAGPAFAEAFEAYLRECALRVAGLDLTTPTMAERPELVLELIRGQLDRGFDPAADMAELAAHRAEATGEARVALTERPDDLVRFETALERAQTAYPLRDDSSNMAKLAAALFRRAVLDLGDRLTSRGGLDSAADVFLLELPEATAALSGNGKPRDIARRRAAEQAWAEANPGPGSYGEAPAGPPAQSFEWLAMLPRDVQLVVKAGMWVWREAAGNLARSGTESTEHKVRGLGASAGRYVGPVRVILHESEFDKLRPGDVLVCPQTTAEWSVLFPNIGALVTDQGSLLSHPAIIAREYRVPAVVATGRATQLLTDGQIVAVDGGNGIVEVIS